MKKHPVALLGLFGIAFSLVLISCKKDARPASPRTIRYILYTKQDFSNDDDTIRFRVHMHSTGITGRNLLDSFIAPMTISAIPDSMHAIVIDKNVPSGYEQQKLVIGWVYDIDNVGESWHLDSLSPGENHKTVVYDFR
jgi:hypothetical protein